MHHINRIIRLIALKLLPYWAINAFRRFKPRRPGSNFSWVVKHLAVEPKTIFDVGANIGDTVVTFKTFAPAAKIYAFEPVSSTFQQLRKNTKKFHDQVLTYQVGFSSEKKKQLINITSFHGANTLGELSDD